MSWDQELLVVVTVANHEGVTRDEVAAVFESALSCYKWPKDDNAGENPAENPAEKPAEGEGFRWAT